MPDNDDVIEHAVVRVSPDLEGFRRQLIRDIKAATAGVKAHVDVDLEDASKKLSRLAKSWRDGPALMPFSDEDIGKQFSDLGRRLTMLRHADDLRFKRTRNNNESLERDKKAAQKAESDRFFKDLGKRFDAQRAGIKATEKAQKGASDRYFADLGKQFDAQRAGQKATAKAQQEASDKYFKDLGRMFDAQKAGEKSTAKARKDASDQYFTDLGKRFDAQRAGLKATAKTEQETSDQAIRNQNQIFQGLQRNLDLRQKGEAATRARADADAKTDRDRIANETKTDQTISAMFADLADFRLKNEQGLADDLSKVRQQSDRDAVRDRRALEAVRIAATDTEARVERAAIADTEKAEKDSNSRRKSSRDQLRDATRFPKIIDFGGEGIRPMNALIGVGLALSPVLFAVASSALQASTAIAALGTAGIGAATGLGGFLAAWSGVAETLKLQSAARMAGVKAAPPKVLSGVKGSITAANNARSIASAERAVADAQRGARRAQQDINDARREALQDLLDLREAVSDYALTESGAALAVDKARADQAETNRNFWASELEKRQAAQDVAEAEERLSDIQRDRVQKTAELARAEKKGVAGSDKVRQAQERQADAARSIADAQERLIEARQKPTALGGAVPADALTDSAADRALADRRARLSQAGREMVDFLDGPARLGLEGFQRRMESAILPGFLDFLKKIGTDGKDAGSTLNIIGDSAERLGRMMGGFASKAADLFATDWFRGDLTKINGESERSFSLLGQAAITMIRPLMTIIRASSPLLTKFSGWVLKLATRFSEFIEKADKDGRLTKWFTEVGEKAAKWGHLIGETIRFVFGLFKGSAPSGDTMLDRIDKFITRLADWSNSDKGQRQIAAFFGWFTKLDYEKIGKFFLELTAVLIAWHLVKSLQHPILALFTAIATIDPQLLADVTTFFAEGVVKTLRWIKENPKSAGILLAIFAGLKLGSKAVDIGVKLPAIDNLKTWITSKFKPLDVLTGGTKAATMTVTAGVVNVYGGAGIGTKPGGPTIVDPPGSTTKPRPSAPGIITPPGSAVPAVETAASKAGGLRTALTKFGPKLAKGGFWAMVAALVADPIIDALMPADGNAGSQDSRVNTSLKTAVAGAGIGAWIGSMIAPGIGTAIGTALGAIAGGLGGYLWEPMKQFFATVNWGELFIGLGNYFLTLPDRFNEWASPTRAKISNFFGGMAGWIVVGIVQGIPALWEYMDGLGMKFRAWAYQAVMWVGNYFATLPDNIGKTLVSLPDVFSNIWKKVKEVTVAAINELILNINSFLDGMDKVTRQFGMPISLRIGYLNTGKDIGSAIGGAIKKTATATKPSTSLGGGLKNIANIITRADGGHVPGNAGHNRADNILAALTPNEWVMPVDSVHKYGPGFMRAVQQGEYADGGSVSGLHNTTNHGPLMNTFAQSIYDWMPSADDIAQKLFGPGTEAFNTLTAKAAGMWDSLSTTVQGILGKLGIGGMGFLSGGTAVGSIGVARIAEATARGMGATEKQLVALIEAGIVESGMRNISYGDRDSVGFLQQRAGWGSVAERMNVAHATASFIRSAKAKDRPGLSTGQLAQAVQVSAFPDRYGQREADAVAILNRETPGVSIGGGGPLGSKGGGRGWQWEENVLRAAFGNKVQFFSTTGGGHAKSSWHYKGRALDLTPSMEIYNWIRSNYGANTLELIYSPAVTGIKNGKAVNIRGFYGNDIYKQHFNHVHWAFGKGGQVPTFDQGGVLAPGINVVNNATGGPEELRPPGTGRLDRRDITLLAQAIAAAVANQHVHMDGRRVGEIVRSYDYLPQGL